MRPYLRAANVTWGGLALTDVKQMDFTLAESATYELRAGDLLLSEASGSPGEVGKPAQYRNEIEGCCFQNTLLRVRLPEGLGPTFYEHFFREQALNRRFAAGARGVGIHHLGAAALADWRIPVVPVAEQGRIVAAIEEAFSKLDAGETGLRSVRQRLKRMREAVLNAAVTGRLVPQDSKDSANRDQNGQIAPDLETIPPSWSWASLGDVASIGGGIQKQPKRAPRDNPVPFLRVANVGRGTLDLTDVHAIELFDGELDRYALQSGDLLVVEGNGSPDQIGRGALWHGKIAPCVHQNHLIRVRSSSVLNPTYLEVYWNSPNASRRIQAVASSTSGLHTLSTGKLRAVPIPLPPLPEQHRIVAEVERQQSFIDACERAVDAALARAAALRRSILKAAFEGRLVPQDPDDEPASALLERIRAERDTTDKANVPSRRKKAPRK